jgi:hypothetical protein
MTRFALLATIAAVVLAATATADAATKKKPRAGKPGMVATERGYVSRPVGAPYGARPWNQPRQPNQGWPTSVNDGSFSYGIGPGRDFR